MPGQRREIVLRSHQGGPIEEPSHGIERRLVVSDVFIGDDHVVLGGEAQAGENARDLAVGQPPQVRIDLDMADGMATPALEIGEERRIGAVDHNHFCNVLKAGDRAQVVEQLVRSERR